MLSKTIIKHTKNNRNTNSMAERMKITVWWCKLLYLNVLRRKYVTKVRLQWDHWRNKYLSIRRQDI